MTDEGLMSKIKTEMDHMDPSFAHGGRMLQQGKSLNSSEDRVTTNNNNNNTTTTNNNKGEGAEEMERLEGEQPKSPTSKEDSKYLEITKEKPIRLQVKVVVPIKENPRFNFVGKLLGPKGNSLKRLQEETMTKMAILGKGSMRDKAKEEELRQQNDPKYAHLSEDLHVEINAFASPAEAYARISHALIEIKKFLSPDYNDEIRQTQLQELAYINGSAPTGPPPAPRAITSRPGAARPPPPPGRPVMAPGRAAAARVPAPPPPRVATYRTAVADTRTYDDGYEYQDAYEQSDQYYDYGTNPMDAYEDEYAAEPYAVAEDWRPGNDTPRLKAPPARPSPRGAYREHPYPPQIPRY